VNAIIKNGFGYDNNRSSDHRHASYQVLIFFFFDTQCYYVNILYCLGLGMTISEVLNFSGRFAFASMSESEKIVLSGLN